MFLQRKNPGPDALLVKSIKYLRGKKCHFCTNSSKELKKREYLSTYSLKPALPLYQNKGITKIFKIPTPIKVAPFLRYSSCVASLSTVLLKRSSLDPGLNP